MSNFPVVRARSAVVLPRERSVERGDVATLTRVTFVPYIDNVHNSKRRCPSTLFNCRRDQDLFDNCYNDGSFFGTPLYWQDYKYAACRYTDTIPNWLNNTTYWRRYYDPKHARFLWKNWQPWHLDRNNVKRAICMFKEGLIGFELLDRVFIAPTALSRKGKDWTGMYLPAGRYGSRRYFYAFI